MADRNPRNSGISVKGVMARAMNEERRAVPIPVALEDPQSADASAQAVYAEAREFYRDIVVAGDAGLKLTELGQSSLTPDKERRKSAVKLLRASGAVVESKEELDGGSRAATVLRVRPSA